MAVMRFKRFTKPQVLKQIGRELLGRFFERFSGANNGKRIELPPASATDDEYFQGVAKALMSPEGLPDEVGEALYLVDEMANDEGHERLEAAAQQAELKLEGDRTQAELALEVFLAKPEVLQQAHSEQKLVRLSSFEYYGSKATRVGPQNGGPLTPTLSPSDGAREMFKPPTAEALAAMARGLDEWFAAHNRGKGAARVEVYQIDGEYYFIIRHGDTFIRTAKVNEQRTEVLHFRPEKDDVVVYSPELDEIRIKAGTKGERELYRKQFGQRLFGDEAYFSQKKAYTLEPLRAKGADALEAEGCGDLERVVLREYEVAWDNGFEEVASRKATDIFAAAESRPEKRAAIPASGRLVRAVFDLYFVGQRKPRKVQVRTPNTLKLGRHCDVRVVQKWLSRQGFRAVCLTADNADDADGKGWKKRGWTLMVGGRVNRQAALKR